MEKRVFKSVPYFECVGTSWYGVLIRASLYELLRVFRLKRSSIHFYSIYDKTRYELCIKTAGLPCFTIYDRCVFDFGRIWNCEFDTVIDWHLGTFNKELSLRTCKLLKSLGLNVVVDFFVPDEYTDLPF